MKFFWKIFFTTMFVSVICVSLSGYLLIRSNFQTQLESEVTTALDYSEIVYYSLANEFGREEFGTVRKNLLQLAQSIHIGGINQRVAFGILDEEQNTIYSSLDVQLDKAMVTSLTETDAGWTLKQTQAGTYVQTIRPAQYQGTLFYIETIRDVTHVFRDQQSQYKMLVQILSAMIGLAGALTFVISTLLLRPISRLTQITKAIADGNLKERVPVRGQDEISLLSKNFNQMADRLEDKICELQEEAERKELFVGSFSHELKTPLTSIIGYADLLRRKELDGEQRHICAEYIFSEGKRLETLSMRLLELIVLKKQSISPKPANIRDILEEVTQIAEPQLTDTGIRLVFCAEPARISMETELLKTVFLNLIDNARKAIDGTGTITITGRRLPGSYIVTVRDTGKGMERKELPKITEAFYMVDKSRSRKQGGSGLGLAICSEILRLHRFELSFDSTVNVGTTVTVTMKEGKS